MAYRTKYFVYNIESVLYKIQFDVFCFFFCIFDCTHKG